MPDDRFYFLRDRDALMKRFILSLALAPPPSRRRPPPVASRPPAPSKPPAASKKK